MISEGQRQAARLAQYHQRMKTAQAAPPDAGFCLLIQRPATAPGSPRTLAYPPLVSPDLLIIRQRLERIQAAFCVSMVPGEKWFELSAWERTTTLCRWCPDLDTAGNPLYLTTSKPVFDKEGNPLLDTKGKPLHRKMVDPVGRYEKMFDIWVYVLDTSAELADVLKEGL